MLVFLDTETTGLSFAEGDRLVSIAMLKNGEHIQLFVNPGRPSSPGALKIHRLTEEFLSDKPSFSQVYQQILNFISPEDIIVAHNANFDLDFINGELALCGQGPLKNKVIDSLRVARERLKGVSCSLDNLCKYFNIDTSLRQHRHDSLVDCLLLSQVFAQLYK